ncbi:Hsp20/alpha crystallin family protein [Fulvivirga sediminis]|uniref:Hsp20/alpha crystallin family protein n=1 Tax=Fulvivirga sediminis TaxID=2803949 RepID=A0A937K2C4_9BACT|nr:Hsp20/alpha crystallin family protein [Fulvivirga sediminis]MBL3657657.1 Hsp20/alpha crystallin family protein [Fulvivirga sediminis]
MNLFKWTKNLKPVYQNVIGKLIGKQNNKNSSEEAGLVPSVNIDDKDKAFEASVAVPGVDKKDIKLKVENNCLIISSEKEYHQEENEGHWMRKQYGYASFQRIFMLPANADPEKIDASIKNGLLTIRVGKNKNLESTRKIIAVC